MDREMETPDKAREHVADIAEFAAPGREGLGASWEALKGRAEPRGVKRGPPATAPDGPRAVR